MSDGKRPKFTFEIDAELRAAATTAAREKEQSLSAWVRDAIEAQLVRNSAGHPDVLDQATLEEGRESLSATVSAPDEDSELLDLLQPITEEQFASLIEDDVPPEPEEMWVVTEIDYADRPKAAQRLSGDEVADNAALNDGREAAVERARLRHGAALLCTKNRDCPAYIHFPGCPRSTLKAIK